MNLQIVMALTPCLVMLTTAILTFASPWQDARGWRCFNRAAMFSLILVISAMISLMTQAGDISARIDTNWGLALTPLQSVLAVLVQLLGWVIGVFSARYLEGEAHQRRFVTALSLVLVSVHLLLIADHWLLFAAAWSSISLCMRHLLCFYEQRPFALLASHKKTVADMLADSALLFIALLAYVETGSMHISVFLQHVSSHGASQLAAWCAGLLVLVVVLKTALLPVHGWLIQVMEAPTPVSALLHAGVVNLSGFVLIRFAPLMEHYAPARHCLMGIGLITCMVASLVMLTRVSIKVRLAWSTVAQMGFMVVECALGLYTFAALHLIGHSIYKAYAFLSAAEVVTQTRLKHLTGKPRYYAWSLWLAPCITLGIVFAAQAGLAHAMWPAWWSVVLALAWAPLLWLHQHSASSRWTQWQPIAFGSLLTLILTVVSLLFHTLPLGVQDHPHANYASWMMLGMLGLYVATAMILLMPARLGHLHRWIYAGLYLDEFYTRNVLRLWPISWGKESHANR
jgi:NAD(P)H-quinone oxidoreductase subunit 5